LDQAATCSFQENQHEKRCHAKIVWLTREKGFYKRTSISDLNFWSNSLLHAFLLDVDPGNSQHTDDFPLSAAIPARRTTGQQLPEYVGCDPILEEFLQ
jgi:hypothetical protein